MFFETGWLDSTFAFAGRRAVDFGGVIDEVHDVAVQADGKIVAVGSKTTTNTYGSGGDVAVVRLLATGQPDTSFGPGGVRLFDFGGQIERGDALVIQSGGKIVVGASTHAPGEQYFQDWEVFRINPIDGSLDTSFGDANTGRIVTSFGDGDQLADLALQLDGKIVAAGMASLGSLALARYTIDGTPDTTFDLDGKLTMNDPLHEAAAVTVGNDGTIVVAATAAGSQYRTVGLARFLSDGTSDANFGVGATAGQGYIIDDLGLAYASAVALAPDGSIYITAAVAPTATTFTQQIRKYTSTGARAAFGTGGAVTLGSGGDIGLSSGLLVQSNKDVFASVTTSSATNSYYGTTTIAHVSSAGVIDTDFGSGGTLVLAEGSTSTAAAFDAVGRIVVVATKVFDGEVLRISTEGATSASGLIVYDRDGDAVKESEDLAMGAGILVYLDTDADSMLDPGERVAITDATGRYRFDNLSNTNPAGGYRIGVVAPADFGIESGLSIVTSSNVPVMNVSDRLLYTGYRAFGYVFDDLNKDGIQDPGEPPLTGPKIYVDLNNNGLLDAGEPNAASREWGYWLTVNGSGTLRITWPINLRQTWPTSDGGIDVSGPPGQPSSTNTNFGVVGSQFISSGSYDRDGRRVVFAFDRPVYGSNVRFVLKNLDTNASAILLAGQISATDRTKISFQPTLAGSPGAPTLPDGHYHATLLANSVRDSAGNVLPYNQLFDFTFRRGDANGDGAVDFNDLVVLAQNYGQSGKTFSQGNFNYDADGKVDFDDLVILAQNYGASALSLDASIFPASGVTASVRGRKRDDTAPPLV